MPPELPHNSFLIRCRNALFSGALLLAPLWVTIWAFTAFIGFMGGTVRPLYHDYLPETLQSFPFFWDLLGTIVMILLITAFGFLSSYVFGRLFLSMGERFILNIPGVGAVYQSVKQIVSTFGSSNRSLFNQVVLVEYPRKGCWTLGFLTNRAQGEAQATVAHTEEIWTVFVPTTPNPTSGFLLLLPKNEIVELEMSVGDGMKMIISGGAVMPEWRKKTKNGTAETKDQRPETKDLPAKPTTA